MMDTPSFQLGNFLVRAAQAAVAADFTRDEFTALAVRMFDAMKTGQSWEVMATALLEVVPPDERERVRQMLKDQGIL
jgi:predicted MFS family arabinose efflux permease